MEASIIYSKHSWLFIIHSWHHEQVWSLRRWGLEEDREKKDGSAATRSVAQLADVTLT